MSKRQSIYTTLVLTLLPDVEDVIRDAIGTCSDREILSVIRPVLLDLWSELVDLLPAGLRAVAPVARPVVVGLVVSLGVRPLLAEIRAAVTP